MKDSITFTDARGRDIIIICEEPDVVARHAGKTIGTFIVREEEFDDRGFPLSQPELVNTAIAADYQRLGIGTRMLELAFTHQGMMAVPNFNPDETHNRISSEGMPLVLRGIANGWLIDPRDKNPQSVDD